MSWHKLQMCSRLFPSLQGCNLWLAFASSLTAWCSRNGNAKRSKSCAAAKSASFFFFFSFNFGNESTSPAELSATAKAEPAGPLAGLQTLPNTDGSCVCHLRKVGNTARRWRWPWEEFVRRRLDITKHQASRSWLGPGASPVGLVAGGAALLAASL